MRNDTEILTFSNLALLVGVLLLVGGSFSRLLLHVAFEMCITIRSSQFALCWYSFDLHLIMTQRVMAQNYPCGSTK